MKIEIKFDNLELLEIISKGLEARGIKHISHNNIDFQVGDVDVISMTLRNVMLEDLKWDCGLTM